VPKTKGLPVGRAGTLSGDATIAVVDTSFNGLWVVGEDVAIRDIGFVALITHAPGRPAGECGPYSRPGADEELMARQILVDYEVVVHRANDGAEVARAVIAAEEGRCPEVVPAERDAKGLVTYDYPEREAVDAWLTAQRAGWVDAAPE
jgi:hypothetical protein